MKKITKVITTAATTVATAVTICSGKILAAETQTFSGVRDGAEAAKADDMPRELIGPNGVFTQISNVVLYAVGIISIVMLIFGGIRYITSGGDAKKVTDAKNTVLYAIIGLIIAILAFAIVNFVLNAMGIPDPNNYNGYATE